MRSRLFPRREELPQLTQGSLRYHYRLTPEWTLGASGGGARYRFFNGERGYTAVRDTWWLLPTVRWTPTSRTMLSLQAGLTQRFERSFEPTDRQSSGLASFRVSHWLTDRIQRSARLYASSGRTSTAETNFGGSGGALSVAYWPASSVSVRAEAGIEQLRYQSARPSEKAIREEIGRAGLEVEWSLRPTLSIFGRAQGLSASLQQGRTRTDVHASGGIRLQVQRALGGQDQTSAQPLPQPAVCRRVDGGIRLRIPYEGDGQVYVTGDFNGWARPGVRLTPAGEGVWSAALDLPPGRYAYRVLVVDGETERWLDLPSYAQTTADSFGGTNGVCTAS